MRIRRVAASELKPGALIQGEVLLEATDSLNIDNMEAIGVHRRRLRRDHPHADVRRQFQPAAADADHAVHAARREIRRSCSVCKLAAVANTPCQTATILEEPRRGWPGRARP